jgi:predicted RNase H-like HicB family nuclease
VSEYLVIYEQGPTGWGAYCPDLPGLGAAGATREEVERLIHEATKVHIESLREHGDPVPPPASAAGTIAVSAA